MLKAFGQGLLAPSIVDGLELVEVTNQDPPKVAEGKLTQLRPTCEINHRNFIHHYPTCGVFSPFDGFVGDMVDGGTSRVVCCQVCFGEYCHSFAFVP